MTCGLSLTYIIPQTSSPGASANGWRSPGPSWGSLRSSWPTSPPANLDSSASASIVALLEELNQEGVTIVVITHDREIAARFPRAVGLRDGLIEYDTRYEAAI